MRRPLLLVAAFATVLAAAPAAHAGPIDQLYAPLHVRPRAAPPPAFINSHFKTISIHVAMLRAGFHAQRTGFYVKGTRSPRADHPESWYLHGAGGQRVRDNTWGFFVMNPANAGWRQYVASQCRPNFCFLDSLGEDGYERATPQPRELTRAEWKRVAAGLVAYVESRSGAYDIVANNLLVAHQRFAIGYEMFARTAARTSLDVLRKTTCYCFAKLGTLQGARYGYTLFLSGADPSDRISVGTDAQVGKWWPFFGQAQGLGSPVGEPRVDGGLITRAYTNGTVVVNTGRTPRTLTVRRLGSEAGRASSAIEVAPRDGRIIRR
jgi:hypothetical protein